MPSIQLEASPCAKCVKTNSWGRDVRQAEPDEHEVYLSQGWNHSEVMVVHPDRGNIRADSVPHGTSVEEATTAYRVCTEPRGRQCGAIALLREMGAKAADRETGITISVDAGTNEATVVESHGLEEVKEIF